ncbi:MAG: GAF domain-containing protein [Elusimicrobiaceae bacterium]|nr:GAF domain-containing protein [Elusimicrobiaceae bacterium]
MTKTQIYENLIPQIIALLQMETDAVANMANVSAALFNGLPNLNWAGFYILRGEELVLGPFQGKPACVRIKMGRGVCGTAAQTGKIQRVANVHKFPGHIACDSASKSEIVVPIFKDKQVWGVLDIDSPIENRFDEEDQQYLEKVVRKFEKHSSI